MCDELWWYSTTYSFHSLVLQSPGICSCGSWQSRNSDLVRCGTESYSKAGKRLNRLKAETHWNALNSFSSSLCWKYCTSLAWMLWTLWTACALPSLGQNSHSGLDPLRLDPLAKGARHCNVSETSSRSKLHSCMKHRNSKRIRIQVEKELFKSFLVVFFFFFFFYNISEFCPQAIPGQLYQWCGTAVCPTGGLLSNETYPGVQKPVVWLQEDKRKMEDTWLFEASMSNHRNSINTWVCCFAWVTDALNVMCFSTPLPTDPSCLI